MINKLQWKNLHLFPSKNKKIKEYEEMKSKEKQNIRIKNKWHEKGIVN